VGRDALNFLSESSLNLAKKVSSYLTAPRGGSQYQFAMKILAKSRKFCAASIEACFISFTSKIVGYESDRTYRITGLAHYSLLGFLWIWNPSAWTKSENPLSITPEVNKEITGPSLERRILAKEPSIIRSSFGRKQAYCRLIFCTNNNCGDFRESSFLHFRSSARRTIVSRE